ncbi:LOW QUALITY PROTEIN: probable monooxygenase, partial [Streptomyces himastatinicus ATCC 53653]
MVVQVVLAVRAAGGGGMAAGLAREHVRVAVIGSGFGGLGAAVRLRRAGITDFVVLERADAVGGTWRDNSYPGCACDVPSHLYSFSFAPNPDWPRAFSGRRHIRAYLERIADTFGLRPHLRFDAEVLALRWDGAALHWEVETARGPMTADVVVSATGPLSDPKIPDIPGLDGFPGKVFHSARWDHGYDLRGKRVAMVGTGASAIQIVPEIQKEVRRLTLFQRTPPWVLPRMDRRITGAERWLHSRLPASGALRRGLLWGIRELQVGAFTKRPAELGLVERLAGASGVHRRPGGAPGQADPALSHRLQAHPAVQRLLPGARPAACGRGRRAQGDPRLHAGRLRRHRDRGRRDHFRDRLPRHRPPHRPSRDRGEGHHARGGVEGRYGGAARHHRGGLPQLPDDHRAQHRARQQLDDPHDRGPAHLSDRLSAAVGRPRRQGRPGCPAVGGPRLQRHDPGEDEAHSVELGRLRELVSGRQRPQYDPVARLHRRVQAGHPARAARGVQRAAAADRGRSGRGVHRGEGIAM